MNTLPTLYNGGIVLVALGLVLLAGLGWWHLRGRRP